MPNKKFILALADGIYGSKTKETNLMKLQITPIINYVLFDAIFYFYQNFESCRYLFPNDDINIANLNPYFI